jgi:hypothetical protein
MNIIMRNILLYIFSKTDAEICINERGVACCEDSSGKNRTICFINVFRIEIEIYCNSNPFVIRYQSRTVNYYCSSDVYFGQSRKTNEKIVFDYGLNTLVANENLIYLINSE